jgi:hypothetical protein
MTSAKAQIVLTLILLLGAIVFVLLNQQELAVALVGAVAGQGAAVGVASATNGKNSQH